MKSYLKGILIFVALAVAPLVASANFQKICKLKQSAQNNTENYVEILFNEKVLVVLNAMGMEFNGKMVRKTDQNLNTNGKTFFKYAMTGSEGEISGFVDSTLLEGSEKGMVSFAWNGDGEHVDTYVCQDYQ